MSYITRTDKGSIIKVTDNLQEAIGAARDYANGGHGDGLKMLAFDVVKSISTDEDAILLGIMRLHNAGQPFCADVTYSVGGLYKNNVPAPALKFDIAPQSEGVTQADVCALPLGPASLGSIIFDPPFMFNPHGTALTHNAANGRYTMFPKWTDLERTYKGAMDEFWRVLRPKGIVAFKCQDYTDSKTTMTHCLVWQWALERGFYAKDLLIRFRNHGPAYNVNLRQKHARKFHSYWWVFEKPAARVRELSSDHQAAANAHAQGHLYSDQH